MSQDFGASVPYLWDGSDRTTDVIATIRMQFIHPDFLTPTLSNDTQRKLFEAVYPELQQLIDTRFGLNIIRAKDAGVRAGSIEIWFQLVAVGGAVYAFFKDYEDLRKGVLLFVEDVRTNSSKLSTIVRATYRTADKRQANATRRGTVSH